MDHISTTLFIKVAMSSSLIKVVASSLLLKVVTSSFDSLMFYSSRSLIEGMPTRIVCDEDK